ncbi:unnamed protein product [Onchocerca flexuosa]|uniref:Transmembrane protein n=1 Tax=Onchocerca flexuosa TaxID=387005 RepID=A0A183HT76_9BILA|nr:unnamed protein product [Onchocerca flexuosa]
MGNKESTNYHETGKITRQTSNKRHSRTTSPVRTRSESIPHPQRLFDFQFNIPLIICDLIFAILFQQLHFNFNSY